MTEKRILRRRRHLDVTEKRILGGRCHGKAHFACGAHQKAHSACGRSRRVRLSVRARAQNALFRRVCFSLPAQTWSHLTQRRILRRRSHGKAHSVPAMPPRRDGKAHSAQHGSRRLRLFVRRRAGIRPSAGPRATPAPSPRGLGDRHARAVAHGSPQPGAGPRGRRRLGSVSSGLRKRREGGVRVLCRDTWMYVPCANTRGIRSMSDGGFVPASSSAVTYSWRVEP